MPPHIHSQYLHLHPAAITLHDVSHIVLFYRLPRLSTYTSWDAVPHLSRLCNTEQGFSDYADMQFRQYQRLTKQLKPDKGAYLKSKAEWGDDAVDANTVAYGQHDAVSAKGLDRMVKDLEAQAEKRAKFSRRRPEFHDADISYINERNRNFNKKLERFYGKYTTEIRENLERGTAI